MPFSYDQFVDDVRAAAGQVNADQAIAALMARQVRDPDEVLAATPMDDEDECHLFEDDSVSIWHCRFQPDEVLPPHEHLLNVHIAGFAGVERNLLFRRQGGVVQPDRIVDVGPGDVISLTPGDVHAVWADGGRPSYALHVYLGPLMKLKRNLFDWQSGEPVPFSADAFDQMKRPLTDMPDVWRSYPGA